MKKLTAIILDDEINSLDTLALELGLYCPEIDVIGKFTSPVEAITQIHILLPHILFLDIEMPEMNGFEVLELIKPIDCNVIFVTAYDQFAIKAFEFNAVDYLLKPIRKLNLVQAVQKVQKEQHSKLHTQNLEALLHNLNTKSSLDQIALPTQEGFTMVQINMISYMQADSNYTWVVLESGQKFLISKTLKEVEDMVRFPHFFRAHKSYVANLNHVEKYIRGQGGYLVMKNKQQIPVSRTQKTELLLLLKL